MPDGKWVGAMGSIVKNVFQNLILTRLTSLLRQYYQFVSNLKSNWNESWQEIDLVAPPVLLSYSRAQVLDYAGVSTSQDSALISPATLEDRSILKTFRPYTPPVNKDHL